MTGLTTVQEKKCFRKENTSGAANVAKINALNDLAEEPGSVPVEAYGSPCNFSSKGSHFSWAPQAPVTPINHKET